MKQIILLFAMMLMFASCEKVECSKDGFFGVIARNHTPNTVVLQDEQGNFRFEVKPNSSAALQYFNGTYIEYRNGQEIRYTIPYGKCASVVINIF